MAIITHNSPHVVPFEREVGAIQTAFAEQAGVVTLAAFRCSGVTYNDVNIFYVTVVYLVCGCEQ